MARLQIADVCLPGGQALFHLCKPAPRTPLAPLSLGCHPHAIVIHAFIRPGAGKKTKRKIKQEGGVGGWWCGGRAHEERVGMT